MLRSALHSLRVEPADWFLADPAEPPRRTAAETPAAEAANPDSLPSAPRAPSGLNPLLPPQWQVLIATSSAPNRRIIASFLAQAGHTVHLSASADEARRVLEAREVDVLLLDLTGAPGADYEAARLCRRARPSLTIIALTGDSAEDAERRASEIGLDAVISKPVEPRRLVAAIDDVMTGQAPNPAARAVVTRLASHPRFAAESPSPADDRPFDARRSSGQNSA
jgi:CheY-like chemotaxis protein